MVFNIVAGHSQKAPGAAKYLNEVYEDRIVKNNLIDILKANGHDVYDCTSDKGTKTEVLQEQVAKCNKHKGIDVHIHFNAGTSDPNNNTTGTEVYVYSAYSNARASAQKVVDKIASLGFKNRGLKYSTSYYVLKNSVNPAMLIEVCFVDDKDDTALYHKVGARKIAEAIAEGLIGSLKKEEAPSTFRIRTKEPMAVRSGPGLQYPRTLPKDQMGVFTIVEVKGNWGRLITEGVGWMNISSRYVERI